MTLSPNLRGALWMLASAVGFTVMTTLIKFLGDDYPAALQTFYRQLAGALVLLPLIARDWRGAFRTTRPGIVIFRSSAGVLALIMSFYAYQKLPLADANALSFTRTLWLVPLAGLVLREPIGPRRIAAALVGFVGVIIMLRPGEGGVEAWLGWPQLCALGAALLFALTITGMKVMTRDHTPFVLLVYAAVLGLVFSIPPALFVWRWPTWPDLGLLAVMGVIGTLTQGAYIKGMEAGEAAVMAPIDYTRLVFAVIVGLLLFHEVPRMATIVGAVIVVCSTLFISWREHQLAKRAAAELP
ncbi:drug/metabolite transporter (DMT)-like permease [Caulobacter sp. BE264]|uniref:DMT family transporter n=1 Tax=Caulobacter sp. BE264 TaxID=2817724 RepID=UPI0028615C6F|nr:DMT family transporter [Caulobacter sp. BE264]MDR7230892.1 drug/metabolite transporter (DMT)-like permease [Caulobacter sp. BE264]